MASQTRTKPLRRFSRGRCALAAIPPPRSEPKLLLTGERHDKHFCIHVNDQPVELSYSVYSALLRLVTAREESGPGFVLIDPVTIRRLRQALDEALEPGAGKRLVQTGCATEYRLTIPIMQITVDASFFQLEQINVITQHEAAALRARLSPAEILLQSTRNRKEIQRK